MKKPLTINSKFYFGKYKFRTVKWVIYNDIRYIEWMLDNTDIKFSKEIHNILNRNKKYAGREAVVEKVKEFKYSLMNLYGCARYYDLTLHLGRDLIKRKIKKFLSKPEYSLYNLPPKDWNN